MAVACALGCWWGLSDGQKSEYLCVGIVVTGSLGMFLRLTSPIRAIAATLCFAGIGALLGLSSATRPAPILDGWAEGSGVVIEQPSLTRRGIRTLVQLDSMYTADTALALSHTFVVYSTRELRPNLTAGTRIHFRGRFRPHADSLPAGYRSYLRARQIHGSVWVNAILRSEPSTTLAALPLRIQTYLVDQFNRHSNGDTAAAALARALLVGDRSGLSTDDRQVFARSGAAHVLAISGAHLSVVLISLSVLLQFLGANRFGRYRWPWSMALATVLIGYALIAGGSPPVARAAILAVIVLVGHALYRRIDLLNALAATVLIQLAWSPYTLFDAGFLLSVSAVIGILLAMPLVELRSAAAPGSIRWAWQHTLSLVLVTLIATLFTLPAVWALFGRFPLWFLPANLALVPLASVATVVGATFMLLHWVPFLGGVLGAMLMWLCNLMGSTAQFFATLPGASLELPPLDAIWAVLGFTILCTGALLLQRNRRQHTHSSPSFSL